MNLSIPLCLATALLLSTAMAVTGEDSKPTEAGITKLFPGTWERAVDAPNMTARFEAKVKKDGTYTFKGKIKNDKGESSVEEEGTWKVDGDTVTLTPKNPPAGAPKSTKFSVQEIGDKTLKWKNERKPEADVWTRVKE